jgi:ABC-type nitrate/sulfonate/bicarbonate transport system substrate-binding protein
LPRVKIAEERKAGFATSEQKIKTARQEIVELLKATIEGIEYTWSQREGTIDIIAKWIKLNPPQAARAYDSVRDTFSKNCAPTEEQAKALHRDAQLHSEFERRRSGGIDLRFLPGRGGSQGIGAEEIAPLCEA